MALPPGSSAPPPLAGGHPALHGMPVSSSAHSRPTPRPIPPPSSSSSWPLSATSPARPALPRRSHASRPQSLRHSRRRIEQGPQRNQLASDLQPLHRSRPFWSSRCVTTARPTPNTILQALRDQQPATDRRLSALRRIRFRYPRTRPGGRPTLSPPALRLGRRRPVRSRRPPSTFRPPTRISASWVMSQQSELAHRLGRTESHNVFANRCLWTSVRRSKSLPNGGSLPPNSSPQLQPELRRALNWLQSQKELVFSPHSNRQRAVE